MKDAQKGKYRTKRINGQSLAGIRGAYEQTMRDEERHLFLHPEASASCGFI